MAVAGGGVWSENILMSRLGSALVLFTQQVDTSEFYQITSESHGGWSDGDAKTSSFLHVGPSRLSPPVDSGSDENIILTPNIFSGTLEI